MTVSMLTYYHTSRLKTNLPGSEVVAKMHIQIATIPDNACEILRAKSNNYRKQGQGKMQHALSPTGVWHAEKAIINAY